GPPAEAGRSRGRSGRQRVENQIGAGQNAWMLGLMAPGHGAVGADDDQRALGEAARVQDAEGLARRALGLEVRELLDLDAELGLERGLRVGGVAGDAVERGA